MLSVASQAEEQAGSLHGLWVQEQAAGGRGTSQIHCLVMPPSPGRAGGGALEGTVASAIEKGAAQVVGGRSATFQKR